jgi:3-hydroxyisobutyrate dehydrogenase
MMRVGFAGLGAMGAPMARNLHRAGLLEAVWNRSGDKATALGAELGCQSPGSLAALAALVDAVVICVSADADVRSVLEQLGPGLRKGALVIDCSTVSAETARWAEQFLAQRSVQFLDAPVSGGVEGAQKGTLAIMTGGDPSAFERAKPILAAMGKTIEHFGPAGSGQATKATNQIMCAGIIRACAEAMAFAGAHQLPLERVVSTLGAGAGSSWYFVHRAPNMVRGSYPAGFRIKLHAKDLGICRDMAARFGVSLPVVDSMLAEYAELMAQGYGDEDISATHRLKQALFKNPKPRGP